MQALDYIDKAPGELVILYYNSETQETYQVHVIVTRDENEFLGPFDIVEMKS